VNWLRVGTIVFATLFGFAELVPWVYIGFTGIVLARGSPQATRLIVLYVLELALIAFVCYRAYTSSTKSDKSRRLELLSSIAAVVICFGTTLIAFLSVMAAVFGGPHAIAIAFWIFFIPFWLALLGLFGVIFEQRLTSAASWLGIISPLSFAAAFFAALWSFGGIFRSG